MTVKEFAANHGCTYGLSKPFEWNGYTCYAPQRPYIFSEETVTELENGEVKVEIIPSGGPMFILEKESHVRWATAEETETIMAEVMNTRGET